MQEKETVDFVILKEAITNYTTVIKFVDSGRLTEILSVIGIFTLKPPSHNAPWR
jgi:hypothetical protein